MPLVDSGCELRPRSIIPMSFSRFLRASPAAPASRANPAGLAALRDVAFLAAPPDIAPPSIEKARPMPDF
jgi:hypothetical protein